MWGKLFLCILSVYVVCGTTHVDTDMCSTDCSNKDSIVIAGLSSVVVNAEHLPAVQTQAHTRRALGVLQSTKRYTKKLQCFTGNAI